MKQVFLSADDFGRSQNRNKAIDESFKKGLIKSAGLMTTGQYLQDAVNLISRGGMLNMFIVTLMFQEISMGRIHWIDL